MKIRKIKYYILKHNKLIWLMAIFIITIIILSLWKNVSRIEVLDDPTLLGVYGTLLGAVIGGTFTLIGSIWVNNWHIKAQANIKRKNIIYKPLYDEIIEIHNSILQENPFPNYVAFQKMEQTMLKHPQYTAWQRIQNDTRILQTPDVLINQLNKLYDPIEENINKRYKVNEVIGQTLNKILMEEMKFNCPITNIGNVISRDILSNNNKNLFADKHLLIGEKDIRKFTQEQLDLVNKRIYDECSLLKEVIEIRQLYDTWLEEQENTLELLGILIKTVNLRYEK